MIKKLHHMEIGTAQYDSLVANLISQYGFKKLGHRSIAQGKCQQTVLCSGPEVFFVVTDLSVEARQALQQATTRELLFPYDNLEAKVDSVYNLAFEVDEMPDFSAHQDVRVLESGRFNEHIDFVTIQSCVGDIAHTFFRKVCSTDVFLPCFTLDHSGNNADLANGLYSSFDHVAYGLHEDDSDRVLEWYHRVLGMNRILANSQESVERGYVVMTGGTGLALRAMIPDHCRPPFTIVLAEPKIVTTGANNSQTLFLKHHRGPGVHHVALLVGDIIETIPLLVDSRVRFVDKAPDTYYEAMLEAFGQPDFIAQLKQHGILVDLEDLPDGGEPQSKDRFILQKFCRPIIENTGETFFFEIIERRGGARAFGAGNIAALWKALVAQIEREKLREK